MGPRIGGRTCEGSSLLMKFGSTASSTGTYNILKDTINFRPWSWAVIWVRTSRSSLTVHSCKLARWQNWSYLPPKDVEPCMSNCPFIPKQSPPSTTSRWKSIKSLSHQTLGLKHPECLVFKDLTNETWDLSITNNENLRTPERILILNKTFNDSWYREQNMFDDYTNPITPD